MLMHTLPHVSYGTSMVMMICHNHNFVENEILMLNSSTINSENICDHTCIVHTSKYIEIMHATGKYLQRLMGPAISKGSLKSTKTVYHLTHLAMETSNIFVLFL